MLTYMTKSVFYRQAHFSVDLLANIATLPKSVATQATPAVLQLIQVNLHNILNHKATNVVLGMPSKGVF